LERGLGVDGKLRRLRLWNVDTQPLKGASGVAGLAVSLNRLRKKSFSRRSVTAAAKAGAENKLVIAAVNRCATQKQEQPEFFRKL
jgi:hypothetical protein